MGNELKPDAERAAWLADKIVALGDYAKEAAEMLRRWPSASDPVGEPVAMVVVREGAEDEFYWAGKGVLLGLPPGEYELCFASPLPQEPREAALTEPSGETLAQREEVCAAWADLPDELRKDKRLRRLYLALGGVNMEEPGNGRTCEVCDGLGTVDETLGGYSFSNPKATCPDCDGKGYWEPTIERELRGAQEVKAGEWLPIETAPKEQGAEVLGWFRKVKLDEDDNLTDEVVGGAIAQVSRNGDGWDEPDWLNASGAYFFDDWSFEPEPVLWHPLPAPPSTNESADSRGEKG
jgi:hypothetical protein